jgi:hypothetical protein
MQQWCQRIREAFDQACGELNEEFIYEHDFAANYSTVRCPRPMPSSACVLTCAMDFLSQSLTVVECMSPEGKYVTPLVICQSKAGPPCGWFREYRKEDYWYTTAEKGFNNTAVD